MRKKIIQHIIKRLFDFIVSLVLIILLSPLFLIISLIIKLESPGKAIFSQERMGKGLKTFNIKKFRTMANPPEGYYSVGGVLYDKNGERLGSSLNRITKFGGFLRKTSLDELMQLINILNGTMSFIGPRPPLPYQVENYSEEQKRRFLERPGVTGLAQVNGRNDITWTEKIQWDLKYIDNFSLWLDVKIFFKTIVVVFKKENIDFNKEDSVTKKN